MTYIIPAEIVLLNKPVDELQRVWHRLDVVEDDYC